MHLLTSSEQPAAGELRTAICLSGLQRFNSHALEFCSGNIVGAGAVDYFLYLWPGDHATEQALAEAFFAKVRRRAARVFATIGQPFTPALDFPYVKGPEVTETSLMHMFKGIEQANAMKQAVEAREGFVYDIAMRLRTDVAVLGPLDLVKFLPLIRENILITPDRGNYVGYNDQFAFSSSPTMNTYAAVFDQIPGYCAQGCPLHPESLLKVHLQTFGVETLWAALNAIIMRF